MTKMNSEQIQNVILSVILPVFNESATIAEAINAVLTTPYRKEIIVIDDGSTDGTRDILAGVRHPEVSIVFHEKNTGKGGAIRSGFSQTTGDIILIQDADLEYDPSEYHILLQPILAGKADVVYG
jgi:glycosyltransferase involved in cell wall biosynthesis